jgi:hypothetical protein
MPRTKGEGLIENQGTHGAFSQETKTHRPRVR